MPGDSLVPPEVDFDRLLASLKDLSELVVDSDAQVTPEPSGTRYHVLEPIPLKLYRNGIMMFDGPFRPFHDPSTQVGVGGGQRGDKSVHTQAPLLLPHCSTNSWRWWHPVHLLSSLPSTGTQIHAELAEPPTPTLAKSWARVIHWIRKPVVQGLPSRQKAGCGPPHRSSHFSPFLSPLQRCLRDILDGFFPSELQRLYPDGVPFKVMGYSNQPLPLWGFWRVEDKQLPQASPSLRHEATSGYPNLMTSRRRVSLKQG